MEQEKQRVAIRVKQGGHNIPLEVIQRRYVNGIQNLFKIYLPLVNECLIFDNSEGNHLLVASKENNKVNIYHQELLNLSVKKYKQ